MLNSMATSIERQAEMVAAAGGSKTVQAQAVDASMTPAEVTSYTELIGAIRDQVGRLGVRYEDFDLLAGFAEGLTGKAFGPAQVKRLGPEKLFDALRAAGLRLRVEEDPEQAEKMRRQIVLKCTPRQANQARPANHASAISSHILSRAFGHVLREARKKRWAGTTKEERSAHARAIANERWKAVRNRKRANEARAKAAARRAKIEAGKVSEGAAV